MGGDTGRLREELDARVGRRGWRFREFGGEVRGRVQDWPHQLQVLFDPGGFDHPSILGLCINFESMPLGGERFRDILNADREEMLFSYGNFRVRQQMNDGSWGAEIGHRAFMHGYGAGSGVSRRASVVVFDRCPAERGVDLAERFVTDLPRIAETGAAFAATLQRVYQRTVLTADEEFAQLPEVVGAARPAFEAPISAALAQVDSYPWRR